MSKGNLDGITALLNKKPVVSVEPEPIADTTPPPATNTPVKGRAVGKWQDSNYTRFGAFVRKDTLRKAKRKAEDEGEPDLSTVIQRHLAAYVRD